MKLRSLFVPVAGALLLTAAFIPRANATLIVYFNFEDATTGGTFDPIADTIAAGNSGGGIQNSTLKLTDGAGTTPGTDNVAYGGSALSAGGVIDNRSTSGPVGGQDPAAPVPPSFNGQTLLFDNHLNHNATLIFTFITHSLPTHH